MAASGFQSVPTGTDVTHRQTVPSLRGRLMSTSEQYLKLKFWHI